VGGVLPRGEKLRRAVRWISERRREAPEPSLGRLVDEAALRFDLGPRESEYLLDLFRQGREAEVEPSGS